MPGCVCQWSGEGAGTHVSVALVLLKGEHENAQHQQERKCYKYQHSTFMVWEGQRWFKMCEYQPLNQYFETIKELSHEEKFCTHKYIASKLVNDCLTFNIYYYSECYLKVSVKY